MCECGMRQQQRTNDSGSMTMRNVKFKNCFSGFSHTSFVIICFLVFLCQLPINFYDRGSYNLSLWLQTKWCARGWVSSLNFRILQIFIYWFMFCCSRVDKKFIYNAFIFQIQTVFCGIIIGKKVLSWSRRVKLNCSTIITLSTAVRRERKNNLS